MTRVREPPVRNERRRAIGSDARQRSCNGPHCVNDSSRETLHRCLGARHCRRKMGDRIAVFRCPGSVRDSFAEGSQPAKVAYTVPGPLPTGGVERVRPISCEHCSACRAPRTWPYKIHARNLNTEMVRTDSAQEGYCSI